jgi:integrase
MIAALRGYFRFRSTCGDEVHTLIGVLAYPMRWALSSLPQTLSSTEVERLEAVLGSATGRSPHRADAMVRCALDLGLRRGEIAGLSLDDIDWRAGTLRLRHTKGQREDCLPLPQATGRAIADYLRLERPQTRVGRSLSATRPPSVSPSVRIRSPRRSAKPTRAPAYPIPGRICCATPWPTVCSRAAVR